MNGEITELKNRIERLESRLRQTTRPHTTQDIRHKVTGTAPSRIRESDLAEGELRLCYDPDLDRYYVVAKIKGKVKSRELT